MTRRMIIAALALGGVGLATYLAMYKLGMLGTLACTVGSCETVNLSRWATFLGIPVAVWGVVFSAWLTYLELYVIHAVCMFCVISAILVTVTFFVALFEWRARPQ